MPMLYNVHDSRANSFAKESSKVSLFKIILIGM